MTRKDVRFANDVNAYKITVTGRHMQVTPAMKDYALEKFSKIEKISDRLIDMHIVMDIQKEVHHRVDVQVKVNNILIACHAVTKDMYASIDLAAHKLEERLRRYKSRIQEHKPREIVEMPIFVVPRDREETRLDEINDEIEAENFRQLESAFHREVVEKETMPLKTLTQEEAVMKMALAGWHFMIYRDVVDQTLKVIYRRADGNYGIVAPQS